MRPFYFEDGWGNEDTRDQAVCSFCGMQEDACLLEEGLQMLESATSESLKLFCGLVIEKLSGYLNKCPTSADKTRILELMERRGFPRCFASLNCKHYFWENCPVALAGQYKGKEGGKTMVMEAICDPFLYIWCFNFGHPGSLNDINILDRSSIVGALLVGDFDNKIAPYAINGRRRDWMYFLVDGVYLCWSIFVKTNHHPTTQAETKYAKRQEHVRKDIERCFGVLVKKFGILKHQLRGWYVHDDLLSRHPPQYDAKSAEGALLLFR